MTSSHPHFYALALFGLAAAGCGDHPAALQPDSADPADAAVSLDAAPDAAPDAMADAVIDATPGVRLADTVADAPGATGTDFGDATHAINGVRGAGTTNGSLDVFSLGYTAPKEHITLAWSHGRLQNGPGPDLVVFENPFLSGGGTFMDLIIVEVSIDGVEFRELDHHYLATDHSVYSTDPAMWQGFAGRTPVLLNADTNPVDPFDAAAAGGDQLDLDTVVGDDAVAQDIRAHGVRFVRLVSAPARNDPDTTPSHPYVHASISNGADIDGMYGKYVVPE